MITRHHPDGVLPLEVWDVRVRCFEDRSLYRVDAIDHAAAVADVVVQLRDGTAIRKRGLHLPRLPIERVVVAGGGAVADVVAAIVARGVEAVASEAPLMVAHRGGLALGRDVLGFAGDVLVVDVGQTSVKWFMNNRSGRASRPESVKMEVDARADADPEGWRQRTLRFLTDTISSSTIETSKPAALVLALPCEIADDLAVAGCSYPWPDGDATLIAELIDGCGLDDVPAIVLNDAELAAVSVRDSGFGAGTLVLTVGLGLGGALITSKKEERPEGRSC